MKQALLALNDVRVSFNDVSVLHGVSLSLERGEALGLVGESGSGKSVTWLAALGLLLPRRGFRERTTGRDRAHWRSHVPAG